MMYPLITLADETEIVHSEKKQNGTVTVYVEKPDNKDGFHYMTCILPAFEIKNVFGFSTKETNYYIDVIKSLGHLIMEFSESGGFENASNL